MNYSTDNTQTPVELDTRTLAALKDIADEKGIEYPSNISKIDLLHLLNSPHAPGGANASKSMEWRGEPLQFLCATEVLNQTIEVKKLIGKVIERGVTGQLFGPSGGGKTFVALDMFLSVGTGGIWNGHLCEQGTVLYFAGEGHSGLRRRIKAWHSQHGEPDLSNVFVSRNTITFSANGLDQVINEAHELEAKTRKQIALIIIDTLARHLQGDENSTKDMSEFVRAVDGLRDTFPGSTVIIIHHTGNSAENSFRSRGSSALKAALDVEIKCDKGLLTFTKTKDSEQPEPAEFKLVPVEIGLDEDGEPITSCVVKYGERSAKHKEAILTAGEQELLELVKLHPSILSGDLKTALFNKRKERDPDTKYDTVKKASKRALEGLIEKGKVFMDGNTVKEGQGTFTGHLKDMSPQVKGQTGTSSFRDVPMSPTMSCPEILSFNESDFEGVPFL